MEVMKFLLSISSLIICKDIAGASSRINLRFLYYILKLKNAFIKEASRLITRNRYIRNVLKTNLIKFFDYSANERNLF